MKSELHRKYLAISGSTENIYRNQAYKLIIVDFQQLKIRKSLCSAKYNAL